MILTNKHIVDYNPITITNRIQNRLLLRKCFNRGTRHRSLYSQ